MKVVITGGVGFVGLRLARRLLEIGSLQDPSGNAAEIDELTLFDQSVPPVRPEGLDERVLKRVPGVRRETVGNSVGQ